MQEMHFVALEQHSCSFLVQGFCIVRDGLRTESKELSIVVEQDSSGGLLIVLLITWVENFNRRLLAGIYESGSDSVPI